MDPFPTSIPPLPHPQPVVPISIPTISATVPFTLEPNNHVLPAPAPNPTVAAAAAAPAPNHNHPPYAEMIYTAIGALKEKDESSKKAIGKYIEQVYRDLPPTHSALLTQHLKRLKSNGLLVMVKKSYKLPRSKQPNAHAITSLSLPPPPTASLSIPPTAT